MEQNKLKQMKASEVHRIMATTGSELPGKRRTQGQGHAPDQHRGTKQRLCGSSIKELKAEKEFRGGTRLWKMLYLRAILTKKRNRK